MAMEPAIKDPRSTNEPLGSATQPSAGGVGVDILNGEVAAMPAANQDQAESSNPSQPVSPVSELKAAFDQIKKAYAEGSDCFEMICDYQNRCAAFSQQLAGDKAALKKLNGSALNFTKFLNANSIELVERGLEKRIAEVEAGKGTHESEKSALKICRDIVNAGREVLSELSTLRDQTKSKSLQTVISEAEVMEIERAVNDLHGRLTQEDFKFYNTGATSTDKTTHMFSSINPTLKLLMEKALERLSSKFGDIADSLSETIGKEIKYNGEKRKMVIAQASSKPVVDGEPSATVVEPIDVASKTEISAAASAAETKPADDTNAKVAVGGPNVEPEGETVEPKHESKEVENKKVEPGLAQIDSGSEVVAKNGSPVAQAEPAQSKIGKDQNSEKQRELEEFAAATRLGEAKAKAVLDKKLLFKDVPSEVRKMFNELSSEVPVHRKGNSPLTHALAAMRQGLLAGLTAAKVGAAVEAAKQAPLAKSDKGAAYSKLETFQLYERFALELLTTRFLAVGRLNKLQSTPVTESNALQVKNALAQIDRDLTKTVKFEVGIDANKKPVNLDLKNWHTQTWRALNNEHIRNTEEARLSLFRVNGILHSLGRYLQGEYNKLDRQVAAVIKDSAAKQAPAEKVAPEQKTAEAVKIDTNETKDETPASSPDGNKIADLKPPTDVAMEDARVVEVVKVAEQVKASDLGRLIEELNQNQGKDFKLAPLLEDKVTGRPIVCFDLRDRGRVGAVRLNFNGEDLAGVEVISDIDHKLSDAGESIAVFDVDKHFDLKTMLQNFAATGIDLKNSAVGKNNAIFQQLFSSGKLSLAQNVTFVDWKLLGLDLTQARLEMVTWENCDLRGMRANELEASNCTFINSCRDHSTQVNAVYTNCNIDKLSSVNYANCEGLTYVNTEDHSSAVGTRLHRFSANGYSASSMAGRITAKFKQAIGGAVNEEATFAEKLKGFAFSVDQVEASSVLMRMSRPSKLEERQKIYENIKTQHHLTLDALAKVPFLAGARNPVLLDASDEVKRTYAKAIKQGAARMLEFQASPGEMVRWFETKDGDNAFFSTSGLDNEGRWSTWSELGAVSDSAKALADVFKKSFPIPALKKDEEELALLPVEAAPKEDDLVTPEPIVEELVEPKDAGTVEHEARVSSVKPGADVQAETFEDSEVPYRPASQKKFEEEELNVVG